ncbi:MAG: hypothetical protein AB1815_08405 [Bacillota bacterium]
MARVRRCHWRNTSIVVQEKRRRTRNIQRAAGNAISRPDVMPFFSLRKDHAASHRDRTTAAVHAAANAGAVFAARGCNRNFEPTPTLK